MRIDYLKGSVAAWCTEKWFVGMVRRKEWRLKVTLHKGGHYGEKTVGGSARRSGIFLMVLCSTPLYWSGRNRHSGDSQRAGRCLVHQGQPAGLWALSFPRLGVAAGRHACTENGRHAETG